MDMNTARQIIETMGPAQFAAYEAALRSQPAEVYAANPDLSLVLQAANERRARDLAPGLNVTVSDGMRGINWVPLIAAGVVLLIALRL